MVTVFLDETLSNEAFIYGGTAILNDEILNDLGESLQRIKTQFELPPTTEIKWNSNSLNRLLGVDRFRELKIAVLNLVRDNAQGLRCVVYVTPRQLYNANRIRAVQFGMNVVLATIQSRVRSARVIVFVDEIGNGALDSAIRQYLAEVYTNGIRIGNTTLRVPVGRFAIPPVLVDSKLSPAHQINDVLIGAINFCISFHEVPDVMNVVRSILGTRHVLLYPLRWAQFSYGIRAQQRFLRDKLVALGVYPR